MMKKILMASVLTSSLFMTVAEIKATEMLEQINQYSQQNTPRVEELKDISPQDWAYEALKNLVERYNCLSGYPNNTYQGENSLSRYEFAAALNACLQRIEMLIAENENVLIEDIQVLNKLTEDFSSELIAINQKLDNIDNRVAVLENQTFSTNTKLRGEAVIALEGVAGNKKADGSGQDIQNNVVLNNRIRLNFDTSFTGKDILKVRLDALNTVPLGVPVTGTNMTRLTFDLNSNNQIKIGRVFYRFPATPKLRFTIDATGGRFIANMPTFNSSLVNPITGSVSRFGRANPIYYQGILGGGATANYRFNDIFKLSLGYLARNANDPLDNNGLFNGSYAIITQLEISPVDFVDLGLTYAHAYYPQAEGFVTGGTGSRLANRPFGQLPTSANHFGLQSSFRIYRNFILSGWVGVSLAYAENNGTGFQGAIVNKNDQATIFNWALTFAFLDLVKPGSLTGVVIGNPPKVTDNDSGPDNPDTPWHIEGFYRYPITDNISISPGLLLIINPEGNSNNDTILVGSVRTVFKF